MILTSSQTFETRLVRYCSMIDWVKVLHPTRHKIRHFGDVLLSRSFGLVLKDENKDNKSKHASVTKYTTTQN